MKARQRYYGERMTTCIGREQEKRRDEIQEKDEKKRVDVKKARKIGKRRG